jgi:hypothetical protein
MHAHTDEEAHARTWRRRSLVTLGMAGVLLVMATLAMASTGGGGSSAISQEALDKILYGQNPAAQVVPSNAGSRYRSAARVVSTAAAGDAVAGSAAQAAVTAS